MSRKGKSADQPLLEFIEITGLGKILMAGSHGAQNGFAIRLPGKNDAHRAGKPGLNQIQ
jgi:hypothetical protein